MTAEECLEFIRQFIIDAVNDKNIEPRISYYSMLLEILKLIDKVEEP